jgi:hypothetical protein
MDCSDIHYEYLEMCRVIVSRRMRWSGHVARIEEMRNAYIILVKNFNGRDYLGDEDFDKRAVLK